MLRFLNRLAVIITPVTTITLLILLQYFKEGPLSDKLKRYEAGEYWGLHDSGQ